MVKAWIGQVQAESGKEETSLPLPPLRTVRAPHSAYGSSKSRGCSTGSHQDTCARQGMQVLVAEVMYQNKIGVRIGSPLGSRHAMVRLEFFAIEEALPTHRAHVLLSRGD